MSLEIERKFLVLSTEFLIGSASKEIRQGYLSLDIERTVRVRTIGEQGFLTIKGKTRGISRSEFEYEIPFVEACLLLDQLCLSPLLEKKRYVYRDDFSQSWEVDVFLGDNEGLVVAEIELFDESVVVYKPAWLGAEVSFDPRYFNSNLQQHPFSQWL